MGSTRRAVLGSVAAVAGSLAGCGGRESGATDPSPTDPTQSPTDPAATSDAAAGSGPPARPPVSDRVPPLADERSHFQTEVVSGGVPKDGIPSVDEPTFVPAGDSDLGEDEPVFGLVRNGVARAYPQHILVHHEIVNDEVGGDSLAVTYCPLTGTAIAFERGPVEFGVSGDLLNANLVMYDRGSFSRWPQMLGTAISGPLAGDPLRRVRLAWTTWGRWRRARSETTVMTTDTGYERLYSRDPYGDYNPPSGYYADDTMAFEPLHRDDRAHPKNPVLGALTPDGAIAVDLAHLRESPVVTATRAGTEYVVVLDRALGTGYAYANPDGTAVRATNGGYLVGNRAEPSAASALPLDRTDAFHAMWFAWVGFWPETTYVE